MYDHKCGGCRVWLDDRPAKFIFPFIEHACARYQLISGRANSMYTEHDVDGSHSGRHDIAFRATLYLPKKVCYFLFW